MKPPPKGKEETFEMGHKDGGRKSPAQLKGRRSGSPSSSSIKSYTASLRMPLPAPSPMAPKRDRTEKDKDKERQDQRETLLLGFRATPADTLQAVSQPLTVENLTSIMSGLLQQHKEEMKNEFAKETDRIVKELKSDFAKEMDNLSEGVIQNFERVDEIVQKMDKKIDDQAMIADVRQLECAIRIRGIGETVVNLEQETADGLANGLGMTETELRQSFDRIYRVNSRIATQRGLPRDVVLHFMKKSLRDLIVRKSFEKKFQVAGQEVIIMKELPPRYLRRKRDYKFLADELRKRKIKFRWEVPEGLTASYQGSTKKIDSVPEAREFHDMLMNEETPREAQAVTSSADETSDEEEEERPVEQGAVGGARPKMTVMELRERVGRGRAKKK